MKPFKPYQGRMAAIAESMAVDVSFERAPVRDGWVSSHTDMVAILDSIDSHIEKRKPVYTHCLGGKGRNRGGVLSCETQSL